MCDFYGKRLVVFGDSIINGSGNGGVGVGEYLGQKFGFTVVKYCVGGARVGYYPGKNWMVEQIRKAVECGERADCIIFNGFTNDCCINDGKCNVPLGERLQPSDDLDIFTVPKENTNFSQCFEICVRALKKYFPQAKLLFIRPHKMGRRDAVMQVVYGERAVEICRDYGIAVADIYKESDMDTFLPEHRDMYTYDSYNQGIGDCTHPNAEGYLKKYMPIVERAIIKLYS